MEHSNQKNSEEQDTGLSRIVIGFSKSRIRFPLIGILISWFQKGRYSHTYISFYHKYRDRWVVVDATSHGVRIGSEEEFLKKNRPVKQYSIDVSDSIIEALLWWGIEKSRQQYSVLEIVGNLMQLIFSLKTNPFRQGKEYTRCNELVGLFIEEVLGLNIEENLDDIDLIWLDEFLQKHFSKENQNGGGNL